MANSLEKVVETAKDVAFHVTHPHSIVPRRVDQYIREEFGKPSPKLPIIKRIVFRFRPGKRRLSDSTREYLNEEM